MKNEETERVQGFGFHRLAAAQLVFLLLPRRCKLRFPRREAISRGLDAILRHQFLRVGIILGHAGRNNCFSFFNLRGDVLVEGEELGEQIFLRVEPSGGEDGGVERGVGVLQRIRAGQFEGAIERAQAWRVADCPPTSIRMALQAHRNYGLNKR